MADLGHDFDKEGDLGASFEAEGGASGGPGGSEQVKPLIRRQPEPEEDPALKAANEQHERERMANEMSHGQWLSSVGKSDPAKAENYANRRDVGAAAEMLSVARGAPFVGSHLDEMAGAVQSGSLSGPEYEKKRDLARQTLDAAVSHAPVGPLVGSALLSPAMPKSAFGRIGLNTAAGASQGFGEARTLDQAPRKALNDAIVAAMLSSLAEAASKGGIAAEPAMRKGAETQALKAAGLRGGISNQAQKMGLSDMAEARALGRRFLDEDLIPFGGSKEAIEKRAQAMMDQSGNSIGATLAQADTSGVPFDYDALGAAARGPYNAADAVARGTGAKSLDLADKLAEQGTLTPGSFSGANRAKASAWDSANFAEDAPMAARLYRQSVGSAARNIEDQLRAVNPAAADALRSANEKYGVAADALQLARNAGTREQANNALGLTEALTGIGGATLGSSTGHPITGALAGVASAALTNLARRRGNAAAAVLLDKMSGPVGGTLGVIGQGVRAAEPMLVEESNRSGSPLEPYLDLLKEPDDGRR